VKNGPHLKLFPSENGFHSAPGSMLHFTLTAPAVKLALADALSSVGILNSICLYGRNVCRGIPHPTTFLTNLAINTREYCGYIETIELPVNYEKKLNLLFLKIGKSYWEICKLFIKWI